jgi:Tol biopolymer transport system component
MTGRTSRPPFTIEPAEWTTTRDEESGRTVRQYTGAAANSYPLYYFVPSITPDGRWMVFHSERSGMVQLHRTDLRDGSSVQLTDGDTTDAGWAIWCEQHLDGIFNHLSAMDPTTNDVYYFVGDELRCVNLDTLEHRRITRSPGRIPIGQSHFSPDGSTFVYVDADRDAFAAALEDRERLAAEPGFHPGGHDRWRNSVPTSIKLVDTATGAVSTLVDLDFHVHHVLFLDDRTVLVNHSRDRNGMWIIGVDGEGMRELRPGDQHGEVCHQAVTPDGVLYETSHGFDEHEGTSWVGRYDRDADTWREWRLPDGIGYVHIGNDPQGRQFFIEAAGPRHAIYHVETPEGSDRARVTVLRRLNEDGHNDRYDQQRYHGHPFLSPDRRELFFTDVVDGYSQVCSVDVSDLTLAP